MAIPPKFGYPVTYRQYDWRTQVVRAFGPEFYRPDTAYRFNNGRRFDDSDKGTTGVYGIEVVSRILLEPDLTGPDMVPFALLQEDGFAIGQG